MAFEPRSSYLSAKILPHFQHFNSNFIYLSLVKTAENIEI